MTRRDPREILLAHFPDSTIYHGMVTDDHHSRCSQDVSTRAYPWKCTLLAADAQHAHSCPARVAADRSNKRRQWPQEYGALW
jgi:hypothetical protein